MAEGEFHADSITAEEQAFVGTRISLSRQAHYSFSEKLQWKMFNAFSFEH